MLRCKSYCYLCGHTLTYDASMCGKQMKCPECGGNIILVSTDTTTEEDDGSVSRFAPHPDPVPGQESELPEENPAEPDFVAESFEPQSQPKTIPYYCPQCGFEFHLGESNDGQPLSCPSCGTSFVVKLHPGTREPHANQGYGEAPRTKYFCPHCGFAYELTENVHGKSMICASCNGEFTVNLHPDFDSPKNSFRPSDQSPKKSNFRRFFSEIRKKHTFEEAENLFCVGSVSTTPNIMEIDTHFPAPWLYTRVLGGTCIILLMCVFTVAVETFSVVGNCFISIASLMLFYELNVIRNVSFYLLAKIVFLGALISFVVTGLLNAFFPIGEAWFAGFIEEPAKLLALFLVMKFCKIDMGRYHYKLNGLLFGAAIGFGFEVFENIQYMINVAVDEGVEDALLLPFLRQTNAFWGHIIWSAIAGFALWRVMKNGKVRFADLFSGKFLSLFAVSVGCHVIHNSGDGLLGLLVIFGLLFIVSWSVIFHLIQEGLKEIREEQENHGARQFY